MKNGEIGTYPGVEVVLFVFSLWRIHTSQGPWCQAMQSQRAASAAAPREVHAKVPHSSHAKGLN